MSTMLWTWRACSHVPSREKGEGEGKRRGRRRGRRGRGWTRFYCLFPPKTGSSYLLILQCYVCGGSSDTDLSDGADFPTLGLRDAEQSGDLLHHRLVLPCQLTGLTLSVLKLEVPYPEDRGESAKHATAHLFWHIQNL